MAKTVHIRSLSDRASFNLIMCGISSLYKGLVILTRRDIVMIIWLQSRCKGTVWACEWIKLFGYRAQALVGDATACIHSVIALQGNTLQAPRFPLCISSLA